MFMTSLCCSDKAAVLVMQHFLRQRYSVQGALDSGQSSRVTVAVMGRRQKLQCCHLLEVVGWGNYTQQEKKILRQLLFIDLFIYSSLYRAARQTLIYPNLYDSARGFMIFISVYFLSIAFNYFQLFSSLCLFIYLFIQKYNHFE